MTDLNAKLELQRRLDMAAKELEVSKAFDEAIRIGKEFTLILEDQHVTTRCLVAYILQKEYRRRFPKVMEHFDAARIGDL